MKHLARRLLPPVLWDALRWLLYPELRRPRREGVRYTGDYASWEEARAQSSGYEAKAILECTRRSAHQARNTPGAIERDGVVLTTESIPWPLIAGLQRAALTNRGRVHVLDFGGSLGGTCRQCRGFLPSQIELRWSVVDQPAQVACGQSEFADEELSFHLDIPSVLTTGLPDVLLLSGVLQYMPDPHDFLDSALAHGFPWVILDRTPFLNRLHDRLTVQHVPEWIYPASYPAWFFCESNLRDHFTGRYELVAAFPALDNPEVKGVSTRSGGLIYQRPS